MIISYHTSSCGFPHAHMRYGWRHVGSNYAESDTVTCASFWLVPGTYAGDADS